MVSTAEEMLEKWKASVLPASQRFARGVRVMECLVVLFGRKVAEEVMELSEQRGTEEGEWPCFRIALGTADEAAAVTRHLRGEGDINPGPVDQVCDKPIIQPTTGRTLY